MTGIEAEVLPRVAAPATNLLPDIWKYLKSKYDYVGKLDKNFNEMEKEATDLKDKKADVENYITRNKNSMVMTNECKTWLQRVAKTETEVENLRTRCKSVHKFLWGMCPFCTLFKLGKDIIEGRKKLRKLKEEMNSSKNMMVPIEFVASDLKLADAEDIIPSLSKHVENLLELVGGEGMRRIGIWGMPGVGKTTILKNFHDKVSELTDKYEKVFWIEAHEEDTVRKIQHELGGLLNLPVRDINNKDRVAAIISRTLAEMKYVLLLDQVSSSIDLEKVGIRNTHKHGKVVFAVQYRPGCGSLEPDALIEVKKLSDEDSWNLFRKIVGHDLDDPSMEGIAKRILKELGGLPQVIKAVATSLKNKGEHAWQTELTILQSGNDSKLEHLDEVFTAFRLLYNKLVHDDRKKCLLYGALFPKDKEIARDYLIECWGAEQFIPDIQESDSRDNVQLWRKTRDAGNTILDVLIDACLLERCRRPKYVTMPTIFSLVAPRIPFPQEEGISSFVEAGKGLIVPPDEAKWRNAKRISLMCNNLESLPELPKCDRVSTLLLQRNKQLQKIPDPFFDHMHELQVLDLGRTGISSLPSSVFNVINLKALYLTMCRQLMMLPNEFVKLKNLEVLDICGIGMRSLPYKIGELGSLRCLRISFLHKNVDGDKNLPSAERMIPTNVISRLFQLEELKITVDPEDRSWIDIADEVVSEVASLERLTTLFFSFPNMKSLQTFINDSKSWNNTTSDWRERSFRSFKFTVGSYKANHSDELENSICLVERQLRFSSGEDMSSSAVKEVLKQTGVFELISHHGVQNLSVLDMDCLKPLKVCMIENCEQMETIVNGNMTTGIAFPVLKDLHIVNLERMKSIWDGPMVPESLGRLSILKLHGCPLLKKVFSRSIIQQLMELQHLRVEQCNAVTDIIDNDTPSDQSDVLTKLEVLELVDLPSLVSICPDDSSEWKSLYKMEVKGCDSLKDLSVMFSKAKFRKIVCSKMWWEKGLQLQDNKMKEDLRCRCDFIPENHSLPYATPPEDEATHNQPPNLSEVARLVKNFRMSEGTQNDIMPEDGCRPMIPSSSRFHRWTPRS